MVAFVDAHGDKYGVEPIYKVLPIAPSTYYEHKARQADPTRLPPRVHRDAVLCDEIERVWNDNFQVYGDAKVWRQLGRECPGSITQQSWLVSCSHSSGMSPSTHPRVSAHPHSPGRRWAASRTIRTRRAATRRRSGFRHPCLSPAIVEKRSDLSSRSPSSSAQGVVRYCRESCRMLSCSTGSKVTHPNGQPPRRMKSSSTRQTNSRAPVVAGVSRVE